MYLVLFDELLVGDVGRQVRVEKSTESEAVTPAAAEVGHVNVLGAREAVQRGDS